MTNAYWVIKKLFFSNYFVILDRKGGPTPVLGACSKGLFGTAPSAPDPPKSSLDPIFLPKHFPTIRFEVTKNLDLGPRSMDSMEHLKGCSENNRFVPPHEVGW